MKVRKFLCDLNYRCGARGRAKRMYSRSQRVRDAVVRAARPFRLSVERSETSSRIIR